ncbi:hypothetical protein [Sphingobacterium thalpophilum]|uniref:Uncharacterized protein n=1 Tax=Sphingobacterium thalpophilum TaxID=259 RepID=A0A4V6KPF9_9SPHI|nr:hypothetical protein [Sphingobacterium thalpophilum]VTR34818.1 Uncharacterised protein [Sphingobacterium thalpophilum]
MKKVILLATCFILTYCTVHAQSKPGKIETRWGSSKHSFNVDIEEFEEQEVQVKEKIKLSGSRVFLAFRF